MYYTLAEEEPGHASLMRIYLRLDSEGAELHPSFQSTACPCPCPALPLPLWQQVSDQGWQSPGGQGWVPWDGHQDGPCPARDTPGPCFANVAQGNAHNRLPRTNEKIIMAGKELQTLLEASEPLLGFLACGKA